jgi:hypothetical protein
VGLLRTKDNAAILVVRGVKGTSEISLGKSKIIGYLMPPQSEDVRKYRFAIKSVDSSLFVSKTNLPLYAPYIQVINEDPKTGLVAVPFKPSSSFQASIGNIFHT